MHNPRASRSPSAWAGKIPQKFPQFSSRWATICFYGTVTLGLLWFVYPREQQFPGQAPPVVIDQVAQQLGHPTFTDIREYERRLPQHTAPRSWDKGAVQPRYLFYPRASWGSGWNNVFQEQLLNTHLAYLANRAYVFPNYIPRDHPPFPDALPNGTRYWLHIPMNAFVSGPTGGGPLSADGKGDTLAQRSVSEEWWHVVCPPHRVKVVKLYDTLWNLGLNGKSDGAEMMSKWAYYLRSLTTSCVEIDEGSPFDYLFIGDSRVLSVWPGYGASPTLKYFAWSSLIAGALHRNWDLLSLRPSPSYLAPSGREPYTIHSFMPYRPSSPAFPGLLGIHVRRGDYEGHCINLAAGGADYNGWNQFGTPGIKAWPTFTREVPQGEGYIYPALPDYLNVTEGQTRRDAAYAHCWPTPEEIVLRARNVRAESSTGDEFPLQALKSVYISTNGERGWVVDLARLLKADGWEHVSSTFDMDLTLEERAVGQAVDMSVLTGAETFIGVGFSSLSSNVAQIRMGAGRHPHTIRFW